MKDDKQVYKAMRKVKFNNYKDKFNNRLEKELREHISDDIFYSPWLPLHGKERVEISIVKDSIRDSIIKNKYKKVYKI